MASRCSAIRRHKALVEAVLLGRDTGGVRVSDRIARSWNRCINEFGLDPTAAPRVRVLPESDLRARQDQLSQAISIAKVEMGNLYEQAGGSNCAILLTDTDGVILHYVGDPGFGATAKSAGLQVGAIWSEEVQGTNGMGTSILENSPLVIHKDDHFFAQNTALTCSAAPITDPWGKTVAILDGSTCSTMAQQHTLALINMAATSTSNRMFLCAFRNHFIVRFHSRAEFVGTLGEGIVTFDEQGKVLAANQGALFQLHIASRQDIIEHSIEEIFNTSLPALVDLVMRHPFYPVPLYTTSDGRRFFATVLAPEGYSARASATMPTGRISRSLDGKPSPLDSLNFGCPRMSEIIAKTKRVVDRGIPILLSGETGSGKGVLAKAIHATSRCADGAFVALDCASLPEALIESELFGYRAGAFTGASRSGNPGRIVQANGGTLFLDEIGDMPLHLQARLLHVLEEKEVIPLGGTIPVKVDINIISASHRDLRQLGEAGKFREDLFHRLCGLCFTLPPLRERLDKVPLIEHLARLENAGRPIAIAPAAMRVLASHPWPGNIRQARNVLRTVLALCEGDTINTNDLASVLRVRERPKPPCATANRVPAETVSPLAAAEHDALLRELQSAYWNISRVAQRMNLSRSTLYRKMKRHGIRSPR